MRPFGFFLRLVAALSVAFLGASLMAYTEPPAGTRALPVSGENPDPSVEPSPTATGSEDVDLVGSGSGPVTWQKRTSWCGPQDATHWISIRVTASQARADDIDTFGTRVKQTLCDPRSWIKSEKVRFRFRPTGRLRVGLWTASETEERCMALIGLSVGRKYSCADSAKKEVVINGRPWDRTSEGWPESAGRLAYRQMLINHEVGHAIQERHRDCARDGALAPVMMQQSKGMNLNGLECKPNPWPLKRELNSLSPPSTYRR